MKTVTIYTDGACSGNPGPGGWGAISPEKPGLFRGPLKIRMYRRAEVKFRPAPRHSARAGACAEWPHGGFMKTVTIYTDGACSGNPGPGGWGAILMYGPSPPGALRRGGRHHQQPHGAHRRHPGAVPAEGALHRGIVVRLQVRHRRPGEGLGPELAGKGLGEIRQEARPETRTCGSGCWRCATSTHPPLPLGQGPRGKSL